MNATTGLTVMEDTLKPAKALEFFCGGQKVKVLEMTIHENVEHREYRVGDFIRPDGSLPEGLKGHRDLDEVVRVDVVGRRVTMVAKVVSKERLDGELSYLAERGERVGLRVEEWRIDEMRRDQVVTSFVATAACGEAPPVPEDAKLRILIFRTANGH